MIALAALILVYGALWKLSPKSVAWYTWIERVPISGDVEVTGSVDVQEPLKVQIEQ
jgi:hypothetical protein